MPEELDKETLRWKIDKDIQLYQFYLDMSVKAAVFLMTVTGAIASYALTNRGHIPRIVLLFPALMNGGSMIRNASFFSQNAAASLRIPFSATPGRISKLKIATLSSGWLSSKTFVKSLASKTSDPSGGE